MAEFHCDLNFCNQDNLSLDFFIEQNQEGACEKDYYHLHKMNEKKVLEVLIALLKDRDETFSNKILDSIKISDFIECYGLKESASDLLNKIENQNAIHQKATLVSEAIKVIRDSFDNTICIGSDIFLMNFQDLLRVIFHSTLMKKCVNKDNLESSIPKEKDDISQQSKNDILVLKKTPKYHSAYDIINRTGAIVLNPALIVTMLAFPPLYTMITGKKFKQPVKCYMKTFILTTVHPLALALLPICYIYHN